MGLFDFFKTKKQEKTEEKFVGRYQQVLFIKQILGEEIPAMEIQVAVNRDTQEYNSILEKLKKIEQKIRTELFTEERDVLGVSLDLDLLISEGYETSVLPNDVELENRCLRIYHDIIEYIKTFVRKDGSLTDHTEDKKLSVNKILDVSSNILWANISHGLFTWMTLGGKLQKDQEQPAWIIMSSLLNTKKEGTFRSIEKDVLVRDFLALLPLKDLDVEVEMIKKMKKKLLESNKINNVQSKRVDQLIAQGMLQNKENHEKYPDRP